MVREVRYGILIQQTDPWPAILARARRYEALGLDSIWVADHFVNPWDPSTPWFECWTLLAALAAETRTIRLGPLVSHVVYRNPAVVARQALTVDHISDGRLELGLGTGASEHDWTATSGGPSPTASERVQRFHEAVEIVDRLLRDEQTTFQGRHYAVTKAWMRPPPVQRPRPHLTIAANGPRMVKLAARYADAWITEGSYAELWNRDVTLADVVKLTKERGELLNEEATALGRDPRLIRRSFLAGFFPPAGGSPWTSVEAFRDYMAPYREIGFTEFIFREPAAEEVPVLERAILEVART